MPSELDAVVSKLLNMEEVFTPQDRRLSAAVLVTLREASTQSTGGSEAKPVAWRWNAGDDNYPDAYQFAVTKEIAEMRAGLVGAKPDPLYTSPPGGSEAVGVKAPIRGPTYYTEGKDADWFEQLDDTEFAKRASYAAMDIVDGDFARIEDYIPVVAILGGAADRIRRLLAAAPPEGIAARDAVIEDIAQRLVVLALGIEQVPFDRRSVRRGIAELAVEAARALRSPVSSKGAEK